MVMNIKNAIQYMNIQRQEFCGKLFIFSVSRDAAKDLGHLGCSLHLGTN